MEAKNTKINSLKKQIKSKELEHGKEKEDSEVLLESTKDVLQQSKFVCTSWWIFTLNLWLKFAILK